MHVGRSLLGWKYFGSSKSVCLSFSLKCQDMRKNNELHEEKHQTCVFVCCIMENTTAHCSTAHVSEMTWNEVDCSSQHDAHQHLPAVNTHFNKYWISADSLSGPIRGWWRVVWCCSRIRTSRSRKSKIPWLTLLKSERLYKKFADWWGAQGIFRLHRGPFNHLLVKISCLDIKIAFFFPAVYKAAICKCVPEQFALTGMFSTFESCTLPEVWSLCPTFKAKGWEWLKLFVGRVFKMTGDL